MTATTTSRSDFAALVRRAGLPLGEAEIDEIYVGWGFVEPMLERLRATGDGAPRGREVEPAHIFRPEVFGTEELPDGFGTEKV